MKCLFFANKFLSSIVLINLFVVSISAKAQQGKDGIKSVIGTEYVNEYTYLEQDAILGSQHIYVNSSNLNYNNRFTKNLSKGDLLFIIQVQGAEIQITNNEFYGQILNYNNCGNYEFVQVDSVINANVIGLSCMLQKSYSHEGKTVVVRVPRYKSLTLSTGSKLTCDAWNGYLGGLLIVEVQNDLLINSGGSIDVSSKGFRGGSRHDTVSEWGVLDYVWNIKSRGGEKGESIAGSSDDYDVTGGRYCRAAAANGGGGGNAHNAGGGGGANGGTISSWTGMGNPDISTPSWADAWELELQGFSTSLSSGGGKGGYTFSSSDLDALTEGTNGINGNINWGGDYRRANGGIGGRPLDYSAGKLFMGGGGGAGDENENYGGGGGNGGGFVFLWVNGKIYGNGVVLANGGDGGDATGNQPITGTTGTDAAGGGGAGGTVILSAGGNISNISIYANGGKGGNQVIKKGLFNYSTEAEGPGGGGGGGYIAISGGTPLKLAAGGVNGTTNSAGLTEFPPNGATKGGNGIENAIIDNYTINTINDTVCKGASALLQAHIIGNSPPSSNIHWYSDSINNQIIGSGNSLLVNNLDATKTFWVGTCPGFFRVSVKAVVVSAIADAGADTVNVCEGGSVNLNVIGGINYQWSPIDELINPYSNNPVVTPTTSQYYVVTVTDSFGCSAKDSVFVNITLKPNAMINSVSPVCVNSASFHFTAIENGGVWSGNGIIDSNTGLFEPSIAGYGNHLIKYIIAGNCNSQDSTLIKVNDVPVATIEVNNESCSDADDGKVFINIISGIQPFEILWNNGLNNLEQFNLPPDYYKVIITDSNKCTTTYDFTIQASDILCFKPHIVIPNIFSPNEDGNNDELFVRGKGVETIHFIVYNRWGEKVFESNSLDNGWDGVGNPVGTYVYIVKAQLIDGEIINESGTISLIR